MINRRRIFLAAGVVLPLAALAACSASNGDAIPNQAFDASPLDAGGNPDDPDGGGLDGNKKDVSSDSPGDAPKDAPNNAPVVINELYVDQLIEGDSIEYVELRAAPGTPVDDLKLRIVFADGMVKYEISVGLPGQKVGPTGLWVVSGNRLDKLNVSQTRSDRQFGVADPWGLDVPGAVQVVRGTTLLDVVGYNDAPDGGALPQLAQAPKATVEGSPAVAPDNAGVGRFAPRIAFGRRAPGGVGAADTNNNAADFCAMEASPGFPQKACK